VLTAQSVIYKFPKVVLAHILGEVSTFCIVFKVFLPENAYQFFIDIGSYLTDIEQKLSGHPFFDTVYQTREQQHYHFTKTCTVLHKTTYCCHCSNTTKSTLTTVNNNMKVCTKTTATA